LRPEILLLLQKDEESLASLAIPNVPLVDHVERSKENRW